MVYGETDKDNLENSIYNIQKNSDFDPADKLHKREKKISIYKILIILISLYSNKNLLADQQASLQTNQNHNKRDQNISKITERLESFITSPIYSNNKYNTHGSVEKQFLQFGNEIQPTSFMNDTLNTEIKKNITQGDYLNIEDLQNDGDMNQDQRKKINRNQYKGDYPQNSDRQRISYSEDEKDIIKNIQQLSQRLSQRHAIPNQIEKNNQTNEMKLYDNSKDHPNNIMKEQYEEDQQSYLTKEDDMNKSLDSKEQQYDIQENKNISFLENDTEEDIKKTNFENPFIECLTYKSEFQIKQEQQRKEMELKKMQQNEMKQKGAEQYNKYGQQGNQDREYKQEQYNSQNYQIELSNQNEQIIFMNVHQRLEEFIEVIIMDSSNLTLQEQQQLKDKLYDVISRRVNDLLASIFNKNTWIWFKSCAIEEPTPFQLEYLQDLYGKYQKIISIPAEQIQKIDLNQLSKKVLQTPELAKEIGRLIVNLTLHP